MARPPRRRRLHTRYKRNPSSSAPRHNPPLLAEVGAFILPGFAGFAATRFLTRIAATQVAKVKPNMGKHAGVLTSTAAFLAAWFLAHRIKWIAQYQQPIVVGAGLAAIQSILQLYFPTLGWIVSDATPELAAPTLAETSQMVTAPNGQQYRMSDLTDLDDDPNEFTYNDSYDAGRMSREPQQSGGGEDLLGDLIEDGVPQPNGIFATS
jgi:hypothetical protein